MALLKNETIQRQCCLTLGGSAIFIDAILLSLECNDTLVSVGIFAHSLAEPRLYNPRVRVDTQATPHFARSPFRETFFREMLLRDVSRKFFVAKVFSYTVLLGLRVVSAFQGCPERGVAL